MTRSRIAPLPNEISLAGPHLPSRSSPSSQNRQESIAVRQNSPEILRLFAAQRELYSQAKMLHFARHGSAILLAGLAPVILLLWPASTTALALVGGLATLLLEGVLMGVERTRIGTAATVQEELDAKLFKLPWNRTLVGEKVRREVITSADRAFRGDRSLLRDWYADPLGLPYPLDVLLSQRANLVWDSRLRRRYAVGILVATAALFSAGIVVGWVADQSLPHYLLAILFPSLPALVQGIRLSKEHMQTAAEREQVQGEVERLLEAARKRPRSVSANDCRRVQDRIFSLRSNGPLVPDWWYDRLRTDYDIDMRSAVDELRHELLSSIAPRDEESWTQ